MKTAKGHYRKKHPEGTLPDPAITQALQKVLLDNTVTCTDAANLALEMHKTMPEVGLTMDLLEIKLTKCQLGLFGYPPQEKIVKPLQTINPDAEEAIRKQLVDGRLPCSAAWEIAEAFSLPKLGVAGTCEARGIKIKPCQFGSF